MNVKEYAKEKGVSVQSVYGRIKRGTLQVRTVNGVTHVIEPNEDTTLFNSNLNNVDNHCIDELNKVSKKLDKAHRKHLKAVHRLELAEVQLKSMETIHKIKDEEIATLKRSLEVYERMLGKGLLTNDIVDVVVAEPVQDKKSKKRKKKKK